MSKVRIVTDSSAYLPPDLLEKYDIRVIPHRIKAGSAYYEEGDDFDANTLFSKLKGVQVTGTDNLPDVRATDLDTILDCYTGIGEDVQEIVSIHTSRALSPTLVLARRAAEMLKGRYTIRVIDSMSISFGLGLLVEKAARAAEAGEDIIEIARIINGAIPHIYFTCFTESLNYLERSAELGASQSLLGTMLGIKAMVIMEDGKLQTLEKVQTEEEVVDKLYEFVVEFASVEQVGVVQHCYAGPQESLLERLRNMLPDVGVYCVNYPPSLATYLGPNMIGVVVFEGSTF